MVELAEIFRQHGSEYRRKYHDRMPPSHRQALNDIQQCRTDVFGGHVYHCDQCDATHYRYHSCKNRHCPKCQTDATLTWLSQQQHFLLPVTYFMVTFTLPAGLRELARSHQKSVYNLLFRSSATALQELAHDPRFVGGQVGMIGVLHTWTRALHFHPHVHYLVPAGGVSADGRRWLPSNGNFLVHVKPLSILFQAKFRDGLRRIGLLDQVSGQVWEQPWVVHCQAVGLGSGALKYLARYLFRVAISNERIVSLVNGQVTFRYTESDTGQTKICTLAAEEFIRRFLQHVLPKGFVKVRYYGYFSPTKRELLKQIRLLFLIGHSAQRPVTLIGMSVPSDTVVRCPTCGQIMRRLEKIRPAGRHPP